jgi:hypothetical protein
MKIVSANITGSLIINGSDVTETLGSSSLWSGSLSTRTSNLELFSGSINSYTASNNTNILNINATTASLNSYTASNNTNIGNIHSTTASLNSFTGSAQSQLSALQVTSGSNITRISALEVASGSAITRLSSIESTTGSLNAASGSAITRLNALEVTSGSNITRISALEVASGSAQSQLTALQAQTGSYATTGSNIFVGNQTITGSIFGTGSLTINGCITATGQIVAQTINVQQVTSSIVYSCGSNVFGCSISNTQQFTGSLQVSGSTHHILGSVGVGTTNPSNARLELNIGAADTTLTAARINLNSGASSGETIPVSNPNLELRRGSETNGTFLKFINQRSGYSGIGSLAGSNDAHDLRFHTGDGSEKVRITPAGVACFSSTVCASNIAISNCLGVGVASPQGNFEVIGLSYFTRSSNSLLVNPNYGGANTHVQLQVVCNMALAFATNGDCERMRITGGGLVLVGTTNTDVGGSVPGIALTNDGRILASICNTGALCHIFMGDRRGTSSEGPILMMARGGFFKSAIGVLGTLDSLNNGGITFSTICGNDAICERMRITSGGRVGIGTTTPCTVLSVNSGISVSSANAISIMQNTNGANKDAAAFGVSINNGGESTNAADLFISTATGGALCERMRITSTGAVGIGTTSPNFKTHISTGDTTSITQPTAGTYGLYIQQNTSGNVGGIYIQDGASNSGNAIFVGDNNGAARFVVNTDGQVGIGTPSPIAALQICSSDGQLRLSGDGRAQMILGTSAKIWQFETSCGTGNVAACAIGLVEGGVGTRFQIYAGGIACFACQVCAPSFRTNGGFYGCVFQGAGFSTLTGGAGTGNAIFDTVTRSDAALYEVSIVANPNGAGSGAYADFYYGDLFIGTGFDGSVKNFIFWCQRSTPPRCLYGSGGGDLTVNACMFYGGAEYSCVGLGGTYTIRFKINGYNSSATGDGTTIFLKQII